VHEQFEVIATMLGKRLPKVELMLREAREDLLAFTAFPAPRWKKIWSANPLERLNRPQRRAVLRSRVREDTFWVDDPIRVRRSRSAVADGTTSGRARFGSSPDVAAAALGPAWCASQQASGAHREVLPADPPRPSAPPGDRSPGPGCLVALPARARNDA
jgi:Transposase, Mutator family